MKAKLVIVFCLGLFVTAVGCNDLENLRPTSLFENPPGFPEIPFPEDNPASLKSWELGKQLFYDNRLSVDNSINCGTCHKAELAFSDNVAKSDGVEKRPGTRNAPSLANVAYHPYLTREGGVPTLEMQVLVPIQEHNEFSHNIIEIASLLATDSGYNQMSIDAYGRPIDYFVITRAISTFERSLISGNSPYDKFKYQGQVNALDEQQKRGMKLFESDRTNCSQCHTGFNFTNYAFENNGLYNEYPDSGRVRLTGLESDRALFKVPSLRNIELTAPYMHDGSIERLEDVIEHYSSGIHNHPNKSKGVQKLSLTESEKADILAFLKSLTDVEFTTNELFKE